MASLTVTQLTQIAAQLDSRYKLLLADIREDVEKSELQQQTDTVDRMPADPVDQATGSSEVDLSLAIIDRHLHELADIEAAKKRLQEQRFGKCAECGDDIGSERLFAYPTARRCLLCQEQRERTYANENNP